MEVFLYINEIVWYLELDNLMILNVIVIVFDDRVFFIVLIEDGIFGELNILFVEGDDFKFGWVVDG